MVNAVLPLAGLRVLDFSTLVPGPLATLILSEAGADVVKVERPDGGDTMRGYEPRAGSDSANFALLNRGKTSVTCDLKEADEITRLVEGIGAFDVLVEQFRPGVMERLGLGYERLAERHPALIYCSISGYGQTGPKVRDVGHDLNYVCEAGLLDQIRTSGSPVLPHALVADIGGGAYPAVINILLAVLARQQTGAGAHLDIAMAEGVLPFQYWALAQGTAAGRWPVPGGELLTGGSPRYNLYETADGRWIAAAPLEDRFWTNFCAAIRLEPEFADARADPSATIDAVRRLIGARDSAHWQTHLESAECCCSFVRPLRDSWCDPQTTHRRTFERSVDVGREADLLPALPVPVVPAMRRPEQVRRSPALSPRPASQGRE